MKKDIKQSLPIVAIADTKIKQTIKSLKKSRIGVKYQKILLITSKNIKRSFVFKGLKVIRIDPLKTSKEYNHFVIYKLHSFITTTHILLVQWDGFVINNEKWNDNFYNYDYIGAPFIPRENDNSYCRDRNGNFYCIGNGGFSLRSLRLLKSASKYKLEDDLNFTFCHEDGFFCVLHREFLESKGFKWAPYNIATEFAIESPISIDRIFDLPFGFHGKKILKMYNLIFIFNYLHRLIILIKKLLKLF